MSSEEALRPSQPLEETAQLRWLIARQTEALLKFSTSTEHLAEEVKQLRYHLVGGPNLLERVAAVRLRNAAAALAIVVSLSALVGFATGTATFFTWRDRWALSRPSYSASAK